MTRPGVRVTTGTSSTTRFFSYAEWKGHEIYVESMNDDIHEAEACAKAGHDLSVMTHFGEPTDWLWCPGCCGVAPNPEVSK